MSVKNIKHRRLAAVNFIRSNKSHLISKIKEGSCRHDLIAYVHDFIGVKSKTVKMMIERDVIAELNKLEKGE